MSSIVLIGFMGARAVRITMKQREAHYLSGDLRWMQTGKQRGTAEIL